MPRSPSAKQIANARFDEVYKAVLARGMQRLPVGSGRARALADLHHEAKIQAHEALDRMVIFGDVGTPQAASVAVQPKPVYKLPKLPPVANMFHAVVQGENARAFNKLELVTNNMREQGTTRPLLLVGPPSCGKTMTSQIVARALDRPFIPLSAGTIEGDLFDLLDGQLTKLHNGSVYSEVYKHPDNPMPVYRVKPTVIFIDEAHLLPTKMQTLLLQTTEGSKMLSKSDGTFVDFQDVLMIMGTTDPTLKPGGGGGLVKPLITRCALISFVPYGAESVAEMVRRVYPHVSQEDALLAARAAKLYPRVALGFAAEAGSHNLGDYLRHNLGVDDMGLDPDDLQLLRILEEAVVYKDPEKVRMCQDTITAADAGKRISENQVIKARAFLEIVKTKPMSITALAAEMMATDEEGIKARVHYLQSLRLVTRTPRGVVRVK